MKNIIFKNINYLYLFSLLVILIFYFFPGDIVSYFMHRNLDTDHDPSQNPIAHAIHFLINTGGYSFNHILTFISNILNNQNLTDAHTCYKMFLKDIFLNIKLEENGFSFCPEITTKIALKKISIREVAIRYHGRSYNEGKKINFMDGIYALRTLFKYRFFK